LNKVIRLTSGATINNRRLLATNSGVVVLNKKHVKLTQHWSKLAEIEALGPRLCILSEFLPLPFDLILFTQM